MKKLPIGVSDFREMIEDNYYFVDKSLFIKEIIDEPAKVVLIPRPRRFGKTLNLYMLRHFLEIQDNKEERAKLFTGLAIQKEKSMKKHFCKYPVIFMTFKDIESRKFDEALNLIKEIISKEFRRHKYLLYSDVLDDFEKKQFRDILNMEGLITDYQMSLLRLSELLRRYHNEKPVILIDEYDAPIHRAYANGYYKEIVSFFRGFLGAGFKDNQDIFKGVLTGILRIAKESIFSEMNNPGIYSVLREEFGEYFGFTEEEVKRLLKMYRSEAHYQDIKEWYNGYLIGNGYFYNPWSIINFIRSRDKIPRSYWINTGSTDTIKELIQKSSDSFKSELYDLLHDIPVTTPLNENIAFNDLTYDEVTIYSYLLFSGYLTIHSKERRDDEDYYKLVIPNREVKKIFKNVIMKWFKESYQNKKLDTMLKALTDCNIKLFEKLLSGFVIETFSFFDTEKTDVEKVYQAFLLGLLVSLSQNYEVYSNRESGYGRYDISVIPKDISKKAIIMELKTIDELENETKDKALDSALKQIEEKKYETDIMKRGIKEIVKFAVVFDGKRVWVKESEKN
jgi:hypothetical protein